MRSMRHGIVLAVLALAMDAHAQRTIELSEEDRPVTIAASGIVISTDVLKFGAPPSRTWALAISQLAEEGKTVAEGDLLVQFDANMLDNRVRELAGNLAVSRGELTSLIEQQAEELADEKVALANAESEATKANRKAEQPPELIPGIEYKKLVEQKQLANEKLNRIRTRQPLSARLRTAKRRELEVNTRRLEIMHANAVRELEALTIRAPRGGLVIIGSDQFGNKLDVGIAAHPGLAVVELANDRKLAVQAEIPEHRAARLAAGQRVRVTVDSAGSSELEGSVQSVANTVRRQSRQSQANVRDITVRFPSDAPKGLRLGMSVQIAVEVAVAKGAIAVPVEALTYRAGLPGVILDNSDWKRVVLGERSGDMYVVARGLEAGDKVRL
ncbi:MAG: HlyD family efflux transporter periplasmic adaptor subunit [Gammaproteobacteria bacterium]|nr:HlyD family efflux transporter periplasmic adaptor subunit [Gammaproteobacteria bacterium]